VIQTKHQEHQRPPFIQWIFSLPLGGQALVCLFISVLSGIILGLQYNGATPFYSTATIELVVPFGSFWRAVHYYSSQAFFLLLCCHLVHSLWKDNTSFSRSAWLRLSASIPVALLLLFTGYILRGDATGVAAGAIAENISLTIPVLGKLINSLLFDLQSTGIQKVYTNHFIGLMALGGFCVWPHLRRYTTHWRNHMLLTLVILLTSVIMVTPMEPERMGLLHIAGPWFFLGLQEALRFLPPFWAGVILPASLFLPLLLLPSRGTIRKCLLLYLLLWLVAYGLLTWSSYTRVHPQAQDSQQLIPTSTPEVQVVIPDALQ